MDAAERLITSTQQLLWEQGYVATSPREIQSVAGVGQGSFYHHFDGKAALAAAAVGRSAEELRAEIGAIFAGPGDVIDHIVAYLRRERDVLSGCRLGNLVQDPGVRGDPRLRAPIAETFAWLRTLIRGQVDLAQQRGEISPAVSPEQLASLVAATVQGGYVLARAQGDPQPFDEAVEGAIGLLLAVAVPKSAAGRRGSARRGAVQATAEVSDHSPSCPISS